MAGWRSRARDPWCFCSSCPPGQDAEICMDFLSALSWSGLLQQKDTCLCNSVLEMLEDVTWLNLTGKSNVRSGDGNVTAE